MYIEHIFGFNKWNNEFSNAELQNNVKEIILEGSDKVTSFDTLLFGIIFGDIFEASKITNIRSGFNEWDEDFSKKYKEAVYNEIGLSLELISGTPKGGGSYHRYPSIFFDDKNSFSSELSKAKKISDKYELYTFEDKNIHYAIDKKAHDTLSTAIKLNFIYMVFVISNRTLASSWLNDINKRSHKMLEDMKLDNEVYWQKLRKDIEDAELTFLSHHTHY